MIVRPKPGVTAEQFQALQGNRRLLKRFEHLGKMSVLQLDPNERMEQALERFRASGLVEFAEPDYQLRATVLPNDPHFASGMQWPLRNSTTGRDIHAAGGWDILKSAPDVIVAVVDSGIRYTHQDLAGNMWRNPGEIAGNGVDDERNGLVDDVFGINAVNDTGNPMDDGNHGTHVAGIIGAVGNNGIGIAGVAWNVKLMACKFLDSDGYGFTSDAVQAIDYARRNGAHVINASFGGEEYSNALFSAIQSARSAGIIFVAAAGNEQINIDRDPTYPASYNLDNIVVVGASTRNETFDYTYSNYGATGVDLFAPGTAVYSTWGSSDSAYRSETGTSMAAPHVAGAVALMKARYVNLTTSQIITRLLASVDVLPAYSGRCRTGGRLNLAKALGPNPWANFNASRWLGEAPLDVSFSNLSLGDNIVGYTWDFGDDSEPTTEAEPRHVFAGVGEYNVRLTVHGSNGQSDTMTRIVRVVSNYEFRPEPYSWVAPTSSMPRHTLTDNGVTAAQSLPFEFEFYGEKRSAVFISANGVIGFSSQGLGNRDNVAMPNPASPNAVIAPLWDDLNPSVSGFVTSGTVGTAPNRRFVVTWDNVPRPANPGILHRFQVILEESGDIVFQYRQTDGGRSATIGLENGSGTTAAQYSFNGSPHVLANSTAVRVGKKVFRYLVVKQNGVSFDVSPNTPSPKFELDLENPGNGDLDWSITSALPWVTTATPSGKLNSGGTTRIELQLTPQALALGAGLHETTLNIANVSDGVGSVTLPLSIQVASAGLLEFSPASNDLFAGGLGGPFSPSSVAVELHNSGGAPLEWTSTPSAAWIEVSPAAGRLIPGGSATVHMSISTNTSSLTAGMHNGSVEFKNSSVAGSTVFSQPLRVRVDAILQGSSASLRDGKFQAELPAPQSGMFAVEHSVDLQNWVLLTTIDASNGGVKFTDTETSEAQRFYRLRLLEVP